LHQREHLGPLLLEVAALISQGHGQAHVGAKARMITQFIVGRAEGDGRGEGAEAAYRVVPLLDPTMIMTRSA
jgi:hypothetical protein